MEEPILLKIAPDLTNEQLDGGGLPVGAFGGKKEIMNHIAPDGPVYQAGTLSGNPIAMTAGLTTLNIISDDSFFELLTQKTERLLNGLQEQADSHNIPLSTNHVGGMFGLFFTEEDSVTSFKQVMNCNTAIRSLIRDDKVHQILGNQVSDGTVLQDVIDETIPDDVIDEELENILPDFIQQLEMGGTKCK